VKINSCHGQREQRALGTYSIRLYFKNSMLFYIEYYSESLGELVRLLSCNPLLGTLSSAMGQQLPLTSCLSSATVWKTGAA
jgi:hypothetical protein